MNHKLAKGRVVQGNKLNYLLIKDDFGNSRDITHNINYEIEKILRDNYMEKEIILSLGVKVIGGR